MTWRTPAALVDRLDCPSGARMVLEFDGNVRTYACVAPCGAHIAPVAEVDAAVWNQLRRRQGWGFAFCSANPGKRADLIAGHVHRVRLNRRGLTVRFGP